ncbi:DUF1329 domain-containing protein [Limnobacter litoralis]|uniref:Outer membrane lipoprotein-sorting protein n=1 Tax=Limnobacter litoralis TaxID=481366 RepID=A0ABQ5YQ65_9BURK|nr:DUF1329 domain-containing protein [Limnobacter litoralis]GLR25063.1 hypothetical protein GCM10007875_01500 [Limnobacter litoralis]
MKLKAVIGTFCITCSIGSAVHAAVGASDIDRLGKDLTPIGAEKAGNKDGTIPAWTGGMTKPPAGWDREKGYVDPFASEKPLFTITGANAGQYKDHLTAGQQEMLKRYPSYQIRVFPTHRTAAYTQSVYDLAKQQALKVHLASGGNGVMDSGKSNVPFPIPQSGIEVLWNHLMRFVGGEFLRYSADMPVQADGGYTVGTRTETVAMASVLPDAERNRILYYIQQLTAPSNVAGQAILVHEPIDQVKESRLAWQYNPGLRRIIKAPDLAYDSPGIGVDGLRTNDDLNGYNGSPDRYTWKLLGKKEIYIPFNDYKLADRTAKYKDIVMPHHLNPNYTRYELHRVWVVEGELKPGMRHIYKKRVFYIDEDTWGITLGDQYDGRGELWRSKELFFIQGYDQINPVPVAEVTYDFQARRYLVGGLNNEEKMYKFGLNLNLEDFSPNALRRLGN